MMLGIFFEWLLTQWLDNETEVHVAIRQHIRFERARTPGIHTAHSLLTLLDVNLRERSWTEVAAVLAPSMFFAAARIQVFDQIGQRAAFHGTGTVEA